MNFTASPTSTPRLAASPAFISRLYRAGASDEYVCSSPASVPAGGAGTSAWISITSQPSPIHTKSSAKRMSRIQNEDARPFSNTNSMPASVAKPSLPDSPRSLSSRVNAISTSNAAPPTDTAGRAPPPSNTIRDPLSLTAGGAGVGGGVRVGVGGIGVLVGVWVGVGGIGVSVGVRVGVGGIGVSVSVWVEYSGICVLVGIGGIGVSVGGAVGDGENGVSVGVWVEDGENGVSVGAGVSVRIGGAVSTTRACADGDGARSQAASVSAKTSVSAAIRRALECADIILKRTTIAPSYSPFSLFLCALCALCAIAPSRQILPRELHPRRAVAAALSWLGSEAAHAAMVAQMLAHDAPQDARAATVNHPQARYAVPRGVV